MEHTITRTIPEGEYCDPLSEPCPFLIGEMHSMCFICEEDLVDEGSNPADRVIKHEKCPARKKLNIMISEEDVADYLRSQGYKPTPEVIKAILVEMDDVNSVGMLVSEVMYNTGIPTLENLEPE